MYNLDLTQLLDSVNIPQIDSTINFWMIRTTKGLFYDEFIREGFVALGWNNITNQTSFSTPEAETQLLEQIREIFKYKDNSQSRRVYNKCMRFMNAIKPNDILMIPNSGSQEITFAIAGGYYEEDLSIEDEMKINALIDSGWDDTFEIKCPYRKRRKINVIKKIPGRRLNVNLYKALISYHSISSVNDFSDYILSSIYNVYYWKDQIHYVFNIERKNEINPVDISRFIINFANISDNILGDMIDIGKLNGKMNINSPGDILLILGNCASSVYDFIISNKMVFLVIWLSINGGTIKLPPGIEISFPSLFEMILKFREQNSKLKTEAIQRDILLRNMENMTKGLANVEANKSNINRVIDISKYLNHDDD